MTKLSDMQLVLLATACQRADGSLLPPPASLGDQAGRIGKAVTALIKRRLAEEVDVTDHAAIWREEGERRIGVVITDAGSAIIAAEEGRTARAGHDGLERPVATDVAHAADAVPPKDSADTASPASTGARVGTKQALVLGMLRAEAGASLTDLATATGWLPHTIRAALTGLRKKGHGVLTERGESGTRYRIAGAA